jgi:D-sedoheptulose 7-phosphate isomerase
LSPLAQLLEAAAANLLAVAKSAYPEEVQRAVDVIAAAFERGNKLLVFGNGGSAADAQHICAELVVRFTRERRGLPAIALTCNPSTMTACGNDYGFARVFQRQIEALGRPGDVAWGISTSGNSPNIVEAMKYARAHSVTTVGLTGAGGGAMAPWCDVLMAVPLAETPRIQEVHLVTYHSICDQVEERFFRAGNA